MFKRWFAILILLFSYSTLFSPVAAQQKLSQKYISYDSWLAFNYPEGWVISSDVDDFGGGLVMLASSSQAMQTMRQNSKNVRMQSFGKDEVGLFLLRSRYLNKLLKLTSETTPKEVLEQFLGAALKSTSGEIETITVGKYPAARLDSKDKSSAGIFLAVDFGYDQRALIVSSSRAADFSKFEPVVLAVANSLHFGGDAQSVLIHNKPVWQVSWSVDGLYLATRESESLLKQGTVHVWNADGFTEVYTATADGFEWSPDGQRLLIWETNGSTRILEAATGKELALMPRASKASWSTDGQRILTVSYQDKSEKVWDVHGDSPVLVSQISVKTSFGYWTKDDSLVLTSISGLSKTWLTQLWDANSGEEVLHIDDTDTVTWNSDKSRVAAALRSGSIIIYDMTTRQPVLSIPVKLDKDLFGLYIHQVRWLADDKQISANVGSCASQNCTLELWIWNAETGELINRFAQDEPYYYAAWSPDKSQVLTLSRQTRRALLWDVNTGEIALTLNLPNQGQGALWNREGSKVIVWSAEGMARLWNIKTGKLLVTLPHDTRIDSLQWNDNESLIYTRTINGMLRTWDALTGRLLLQVGNGSKGDRDVSSWRAESPNGKQLVTWVSGALGVRVWDNETLLFLARVKLESDPLLTGDYLKQSTEALKTGDYEKALAILKHVEQLDPDLARIYNDRGVVYFRMDKVQAAIDELTRAIQINPEYIDAYVNRGTILRRLEQWGDAVEDYTKAIELDPTDATTYNVRGVTYFRRGEKYYQDAIKDFTKAIELKPDYAVAYQNRGHLGYLTKDYKQALNDYREYVRLVGDKADKESLAMITKLESLTK